MDEKEENAILKALPDDPPADHEAHSEVKLSTMAASPSYFFTWEKYRFAFLVEKCYTEKLAGTAARATYAALKAGKTLEEGKHMRMEMLSRIKSAKEMAELGLELPVVEKLPEDVSDIPLRYDRFHMSFHFILPDVTGEEYTGSRPPTFNCAIRSFSGRVLDAARVTAEAGRMFKAGSDRDFVTKWRDAIRKVHYRTVPAPDEELKAAWEKLALPLVVSQQKEKERQAAEAAANKGADGEAAPDASPTAEAKSEPSKSASAEPKPKKAKKDAANETADAPAGTESKEEAPKAESQPGAAAAASAKATPKEQTAEATAAAAATAEPKAKAKAEPKAKAEAKAEPKAKAEAKAKTKGKKTKANAEAEKESDSLPAIVLGPKEDAPEGHVAWDRISFREKETGYCVVHFTYKANEGGRVWWQLPMSQVNEDKELAYRICRLAYLKFSNGESKADIDKWKAQVLKGLGGAGAAAAGEPPRKKRKHAPKKEATDAVVKKLMAAGRLQDAIEISGRAKDKKCANINGIYARLPSGFNGCFAYEVFGASDKEEKRVIFYSSKKGRWQISNQLSEDNKGFAVAKVSDGRIPLSDPTLKLKWEVYDGKKGQDGKKGYNEDPDVKCQSVQSKTDGTKTEVKDEVKKEVKEEVKDEEDSDTSGPDSSDDESQSGSSSSASEESTAVPKAAPSVAMSSPASYPQPRTVTPRGGGAYQGPTAGRVCAKLLVSSQLRCGCCFKLVKDCTKGANAK
eukprot:TRINITY_DN379_c0_g1_i1.p1 TRINITY_DN379_c0_g1~~TRINITY_DN379_c0_g1_i1.p1  ORF type:complete len:741 (-),score=201.68 TRINITY_DN379_c0_g1_i1:28-2250(-)